MAVVSAFSFLIGIIICIGTILVAGAGFVGARFKSQRFLWLGTGIFLAFLLRGRSFLPGSSSSGVQPSSGSSGGFQKL
eukprot:gene8612-10602_t